MNIGIIAAREKLTGRLFFQRIGAAQVDLGNVLLVKQEPKIDRTQQLTAQKGFFRVTHEEVGKVDPRWSFKCDERSGPALRLLNLATETEVDQAAATNATMVLTPQNLDVGYVGFAHGSITSLGILNLTALTVANSANSDLLFDSPSNGWGDPAWIGPWVDCGSGMITWGFLPQFPSGTVFTATYSCVASTIKQYTLLSEAYARGIATVYLEDQNNVGPKEILTFPAEILTSDFGENDGQKFSDFTLTLLATGPVVAQERE